MCIRDSACVVKQQLRAAAAHKDDRSIVAAINFVQRQLRHCLLYTSDAADERSSVDLGGRRIIKKKNTEQNADGHIA